MKKSFSTPELEVISFELRDNISTSGPEHYSGYIDGPGDWPVDPTSDPGEEIEW